MSQFISNMSVGDIFDRTVKMMSKTYGRNLIISALMTFPPIIIIVLGLMIGLSSATNNIAAWTDIPPTPGEVFTLLLFPLLLIVVGGLAIMITSLWAHLGIYRLTSAEMEEAGTLSWQDALSQSAPRLLPAIGFSVLMFLAVGSAIMIPESIIVFGAIVKNLGTFVLGFLLLFVFLSVAVYLSIRWYFGLNVIAYEEAGVFDAFARSSELVKGHWWRTLGVSFLLSLVLSFAISIISSPVMIAGFLMPYIDMVKMATSDIKPDLPTLFSTISSFAWGYTLSIAITLFLTTAFQPSYMTVMYFDLRSRNGEYPEDENTNTPPDQDDTMQLGDQWQNISV